MCAVASCLGPCAESSACTPAGSDLYSAACRIRNSSPCRHHFAEATDAPLSALGRLQMLIVARRGGGSHNDRPWEAQHCPDGFHLATQMRAPRDALLRLQLRA